MKISKKTFTTMLASAAMVSTLAACTPNVTYEENIGNSMEQGVVTILENAQLQGVQLAESTIEQTLQQQNSNIGQNDQMAYDYMDSLKQTFAELKNMAIDKWNSPEFQEKLATFIQRVSDFKDFVFNGKELNGITFKDLKEQTKEDIKGDISELDQLVDSWFPDYKERLKNWFEDKKDKAYDWFVDMGADGVQFWEEFKNDVQENLDSRNASKTIHKK